MTRVFGLFGCPQIICRECPHIALKRLLTGITVQSADTVEDATNARRHRRYCICVGLLGLVSREHMGGLCVACSQNAGQIAASTPFLGPSSRHKSHL